MGSIRRTFHGITVKFDKDSKHYDISATNSMEENSAAFLDRIKKYELKGIFFTMIDKDYLLSIATVKNQPKLMILDINARTEVPEIPANIIYPRYNSILEAMDRLQARVINSEGRSVGAQTWIVENWAKYIIKDKEMEVDYER